MCWSASSVSGIERGTCEVPALPWKAVKHTIGLRYGRKETFEQRIDCLRMLSLRVAVVSMLWLVGTNVLELRQAQQRCLRSNLRW